MCKMQVELWDNFKDGCRDGESREDLLTDQDVTGCTGFRSLSVTSMED